MPVHKFTVIVNVPMAFTVHAETHAKARSKGAEIAEKERTAKNKPPVVLETLRETA